MDFRKAEMIELHDSNVIVHKSDYYEGVTGWREYVSENEEFMIDGRDISDLLESFGIENYPVQKEKSRISLREMEFTVRRRKTAIGNGDIHAHESSHTIKELEVKIEDSNLIHIRFVTTWKEDNKTMDYTQEVTYSGSYTVWWAYDEKNMKES